MSQDLIATLENLFPTLFILPHSRFMEEKLCILCHTDETHLMTLTLMDIVLTIIDSFFSIKFFFLCQCFFLCILY